jgi:hypothetical protein
MRRAQVTLTRECLTVKNFITVRVRLTPQSHELHTSMPHADNVVVEDGDHVATVVGLCDCPRWRWWRLYTSQLEVHLCRTYLANVGTSTGRDCR